MAEINLSPVTADYEAMLRRRKMAEALMQQGQAAGSPNNEMAGGYVIRKSPYEGLAKMLQMGLGAWGANRADQEMKDMAAKREGDQKSDMSALMNALQGTSPAKPEIPVPSDDLGGGPGRAAQPGSGILAPDFMANLKTPEARQQALAVALQFAGPQTPIKVKDDESLINPKTGVVLRQGQTKQEFGTTPHYEMIDGVQNAVVYDKQGNRKVIGPAQVQNQYNTPSVDSTQRLSMDMFKQLNLSENQKRQLEIALQNANAATANATNRGVQTQFETGGGVMPQGAVPAQPAAPVPGQPPIMPQAVPNAAPTITNGRTGTTLDLNNPGGLRPVGASTGFQQFKTPEEGIQGIAKNLQAYGSKGINTIEKIVSTWAPANENNTKAYIDHVSRMLGVPANQPLDMNSPYVLHGLTTAIMTKEQGPRLFAAAPAAGGGQMTPKTQQAAALHAANQRSEMEQKREFNMSDLTDIIGRAETVLKSGNPTASGIGRGVDWLGAQFGIETKGSSEADRLRAISGALVAKIPRMEGPQSNLDVDLYRQMAGDVGNASLPANRRLEALKEVKRLWAKYDKNAPAAPASRGATGDWGGGSASGGWSVVR